MQQLITPNPNIPCKPGWCLAYVNEAFGVPKRYGTATAAWLGSHTQHRDWNFPAGVWFPVWFSLVGEPAGHVALVAPDGSVYSTSDLSTIPHHHPDMADLIAYYARYGMTLTYLGWTEDVEGTPVMSGSSLASAGTITNLSSSIITQLEESGVALELKDLEAIQGIINPRIDQVILDNREQAKHYAAELAQVVRDTGHQVKEFTQHVVNPRLDHVDDILNKIDEGK